MERVKKKLGSITGLDQRYDSMKEWLEEQAKELRKAVTLQIEGQQKTSHADLVTVYDKAVEKALSEKIHELFPADRIVGEEHMSGTLETQRAENEGCTWYIDPIDGTTNFVCLKRDFAVSVACFWKGQCEFGLVADVMNHVLYEAKRGEGSRRNGEIIQANTGREKLSENVFLTPMISDLFLNGNRQRQFAVLADKVCAVRSLGCISLEMCLVAEGKAGIFVTGRSCPWDHGAAALIVEEAGGLVRTPEGGPLAEGYSGPVEAFGCERLALEYTELMNAAV